MCVELTITLPPPGQWLKLSREPTLDWALSLKLTLWDSIFTSPPPAAATRGRRCENEWTYGPNCHCRYDMKKHRWSLSRDGPRFKCSPGLCLMLALEPHFDVTLLKSTFLLSICTCWDSNGSSSRRLKSRKRHRSKDSFTPQRRCWRAGRVLHKCWDQRFIVPKER